MYKTDIDASVDWSINTLPTLFSAPECRDLRGWTLIPDAAGDYVGECISYIKREYTHRTGKPAPSTGTGYADGWLKLPGDLKNDFAVERFDRNKEYPKGSYIFNTPTHHAAIYLAKVGADVLISEQNADPDGSGQHVTTRSGSRFDMIMVPHIDPVPPAAPTPAPAPKAVVHPYTIETVDPYQVKMTRDAKKYGLNYDNYAAMEAHPEGSAQSGDVKTIVAKAHWHSGNAHSTYLLEDAGVPSGYNEYDTTVYNAPQAPKTTPAAPVPIPTSKEPYPILTTLKAYTSANNAYNDVNAVGVVMPSSVKRTYYVFSSKYGMVNVTTKPGSAGSWIDPRKNIAEAPRSVTEARSPQAYDKQVPQVTVAAAAPAPAPATVVAPVPVQTETKPAAPVVPQVPSVNPNDWRSTNQPLLPNFDPVKVVSNNVDPVTIHDLEDPHNYKKDLTLKPMQELHIVSFFQKDGITYARPAAAAKQFRWYGVPWELVSNENLRPNFTDFIGNILYRFNMLIQDIRKYK